MGRFEAFKKHDIINKKFVNSPEKNSTERHIEHVEISSLSSSDDSELEKTHHNRP